MLIFLGLLRNSKQIQHIVPEFVAIMETQKVQLSFLTEFRFLGTSSVLSLQNIFGQLMQCPYQGSKKNSFGAIYA